MRVFTIGYEATTMDAFIAALRAAGVERVIDVRAVPLSRRPGFSKNILAASLAAAGIDYVLLKNLGTPKPGRDAAKKGDVKTLRQSMPGGPSARGAGGSGDDAALAAERPSALLCFERNPEHCHRTLLLAAEGEGAEVVDLIPDKEKAGARSCRLLGLGRRGFERHFYAAALAPLGITLADDRAGPGEWLGGNAHGFGMGDDPFFWIGDMSVWARGRTLPSCRHTGRQLMPARGGAGGGRARPWRAGLRPHYHPNYYAAFVLDPDGLNIEAVCHAPG